MSHFITVPTNENGVIFDPTMTGVIAEAMADEPFRFEDVYVYSHGWSTDADVAMDTYNRFSVELAKQILIIGGAKPEAFAAPPRGSLGVGIHWPSEITEDPNSALNVAQLFTFYTMEHRAEAVGKNAVYSILRLLLTTRAQSALPLRVFLLGHSFGCKVICAALQDLQTDIEDGTIPIAPATQFRTVLLQGATDNDNLQEGDIYGKISELQRSRLLVTKSSYDVALGTWYHAAGKLANLFHEPPPALGTGGPTDVTVTNFGGADTFSLAVTTTAATMAQFKQRLIVADLSAIHAARRASGAFSTGGMSGSHSDIFFLELYYAIAGFLFS